MWLMKHFKKEFMKIGIKNLLKICYGITGNNAGFLQTPLTIDTGFLWFKQLGTNNLTQTFLEKVKQTGFSTYMYSKFQKYANQNNTKLPAKTFINLIREISKKYFANSEIRSFIAYVSSDKNLIIFNNINQGMYKSVIYYNNSFESINNALNAYNDFKK